jgi:hypothetical protein
MHGSAFQAVSVTGAGYAHICYRIVSALVSLMKHQLESTTFMQDGAPPHIATRVKDVLRTPFGEDRMLSRHFRQAWPPRSPNLNPCDY